MDWSTLGPQLLQATGQTLYMVSRWAWGST